MATRGWEPRKPKKPKSCHERALGLLAVRARSRAELQRRLLQAGFVVDEVQEELDRLEEVGLVDDEAFARQLAEQALGSRKESRRVVAGRLAVAGVDRETAGAVLDELANDEEDRARALATQKAPRLSGLAPGKAFQRLSGLLARRGYSPELARRAAREALEIEVAGD